LVNSRQNRRLRSGFTLLELLVVMAIAGLLAALIPPVVSNTVPSAREKAAARELAATFRDARNTAINRGATIDVVLDPVAGSFQVRGDEVRQLHGSVPLTIGYTRSLQGGGFIVEDASRDKRSATVRFFADGSSNGVIAFVGAKPGGYRIDVDWLMGGVRISGRRHDAQEND